jgi:hypothetical protein
MNTNAQTYIFVSHSTVDKEDAKDFAHIILERVLGVPADGYYLSSLDSAGSGFTPNWQEDILEHIQGARLFIVIHSPNYDASQISNQEIGIAIANRKVIVPLCLGPKRNLECAGFLRGPQAFSLKEIKSVGKFAELANDLLFKRLLDFTVMQTQIEEFCLKIKSRQLEPRIVMKRGEILPNHPIIDATIYQQKIGIANTEIIAALQMGSGPIPTKLLWTNPYGAYRWNELCGDRLYVFYGESVRFIDKIAKKVLEVIAKDRPKFFNQIPDYVSLGPGTGEKDRILLNAVLDITSAQNENCELHYYPYDACAEMLSMAFGHIKQDERLTYKVKIKAIRADFEHIKYFRPVYDFRPEPNIFALLGNTFGNYANDIGFLDRIRDAMNVDDILLLEVRLFKNESELSAGGSEDLRKRFNFSPLECVGVTYEAEKLKYLKVDNCSRVDGTKTLRGIYENFSVGKEKYEETTLCYIHHYRLKKLIEAVSKPERKFSVLEVFESPTNNLAMLVLRKL